MTEIELKPEHAADPDTRRVGILVGGMGAMVPERTHEITALGMRSLVSGTIATCLSGAWAGMLG